MNVPTAFAKTSDRDQTTCARLLRYFRLGDTGGALVEMALVMPILLCLMTGIFSVSTALYQKLHRSVEGPSKLAVWALLGAIFLAVQFALAVHSTAAR